MLDSRAKGQAKGQGAGVEPLLEVQDLRISLGRLPIVEDISFRLMPGETLGLVGESGSGKSLTALAMMGLQPPELRVEAKALRFLGEDLLAAKPARREALRGKAMAMIFQEPMTALNPVLTVGEQIIETVRLHEGLGARAARARAIEALHRVGIPAPEQRIDDYPHRMSGGMRQRVMIAMALVCRPQLLIADEPTTALDVTIQAQILDLMLDLQAELGMGILFISHDLNVVSAFAERVMILYLGRVMELAPSSEVFAQPRHPYTEGLLGSVPPLDRDVRRLNTIPGSVPPIDRKPPGCRFATRCPEARPICAEVLPPLVEVSRGHLASCLRNSGFTLSGAGR